MGDIKRLAGGHDPPTVRTLLPGAAGYWRRVEAYDLELGFSIPAGFGGGSLGSQVFQGSIEHAPPSMQEEAAEKMDEILVPIEVSDMVKKIREPAPFLGMAGPEGDVG